VDFVAFVSSLSALSREAAKCDSATIAPSLPSPVGSPAAAGELDPSAVSPGVDVVPGRHASSADKPPHRLMSSRLAVSSAPGFACVTSGASAVCIGGTSGTDVAAPVETEGPWPGANTNALSGSES